MEIATNSPSAKKISLLQLMFDTVHSLKVGEKSLSVGPTKPKAPGKRNKLEEGVLKMFANGQA